MRTSAKNKQKFHYALLTGKQPVYELDENGNPIVDYVDEEGNVYYRETGDTELIYSQPVECLGNIAMSGGESQTQEFGVDISSYDAVLVLDKDEIPITETSLVWYGDEVQYTDASQTHPNPHTATFRVKAIKPSLNQLKVLLSAIAK